MASGQQSVIELKTPTGKVAAVWTYFGYRVDATTGKLKRGGKPMCKLCKTEISNCGGTTNLWNHLRSIHPTEYRELQSNEPSGGVQPSVTMEHFVGKVGESSRAVEKLPHNSARAKKLTESIAEFIVRDLRPVSTVDGDGFLNLMEVAEPRFVVPCRRTMDTVIDKMYCKTRQSVCQEMDGVSYLCMTTDMWTSRSGDGYVSMTIHFIDSQLVMHHRNLVTRNFPGRHTAVNIAEILKGCATEWNINIDKDVVAVTTDNAQNVRNAIIDCLLLPAIPCAGHSLNLAVQDGLDVQEVHTAIARAKKIVTHFHKSRLDSEALKSKQKQLGLPQHQLIQVN